MRKNERERERERSKRSSGRETVETEKHAHNAGVSAEVALTGCTRLALTHAVIESLKGGLWWSRAFELQSHSRREICRSTASLSFSLIPVKRRLPFSLVSVSRESRRLFSVNPKALIHSPTPSRERRKAKDRARVVEQTTGCRLIVNFLPLASTLTLSLSLSLQRGKDIFSQSLHQKD